MSERDRQTDRQEGVVSRARILRKEEGLGEKQVSMN